MLALTSLQLTIIACVRQRPGMLHRSALGKLLVGSHSVRVGHLAHDPHFGRLAGRSRKEVVDQVDILLQQQVLALDHAGRLIVGPYAPPEAPAANIHSSPTSDKPGGR